MRAARRIVLCAGSERRLAALRDFLELDSELKVVGGFDSTDSMLPRLAEIAPDLVVLALGGDGGELEAAVEQVLAEGAPRVVALCAEGDDDGRLAALLAAGAVEVIEESRLPLAEPEGLMATAMRSRFKRLASRRSRGGAERSPPSPPAAAPRPLPPPPGGRHRVIGIGASVGGPAALAEVLGRLPGDFALPVLVVQHTASGFGESLVQWLDRSVEIPVGTAVDGASLQPGVWLAPDGAHLRLEESSLRLSLDSETEHGQHKPSLDVLLASLATAIGGEAVGVVLTGMGRDGAEGVGAIVAAGGLAIAQDEQSSAVFGMPAAAIEAGADLVLPLDQLAARLARLPARNGDRG